MNWMRTQWTDTCWDQYIQLFHTCDSASKSSTETFQRNWCLFFTFCKLLWGLLLHSACVLRFLMKMHPLLLLYDCWNKISPFKYLSLVGLKFKDCFAGFVSFLHQIVQTCVCDISSLLAVFHMRFNWKILKLKFKMLHFPFFFLLHLLLFYFIFNFSLLVLLVEMLLFLFPYQCLF